MNNELKIFKGIDIPSFPLELNKVGDLIYFEGSLMSVYTDKNNKIYLSDWVQANSSYNRWLIYEVDEYNLYGYIKNKISHFSLLQSALNELYYIIDIDANNLIVNCKISTLKNIPSSYIPKSDIFFEEEEAIGLDKILLLINLDSFDYESNELTFDILEEAKINNSELLNLHIKANNSKVGYGKIRTSLLGEVLVNFQKLHIAAAVSIFDGKDKVAKEKRTRRKRGQKNYARELGETEYVYAKAASFSVFLRPIKQTVDIYEKVSSEVISECIFNLFEASDEISSLQSFKEQIDNNVLSAYRNFLKGIKDEDISLTLQYANPQNLVVHKDNFNKKRATEIITNLELVESDTKEEISVKGSFTALDSTNNTFKFVSDDKEEYEGKFLNLLHPAVPTFTLKDYYKVVFEIEEIHLIGKIENKEKVIMVSCLQI